MRIATSGEFREQVDDTKKEAQNQPGSTNDGTILV
jgi:hypothetical protein